MNQSKQEGQTFTKQDQVNLEHYLHTQGWNEIKLANPRLHQWTNQKLQTSVQIPQREDLSDFDWLMARAVEKLAHAQRQPLEELLELIKLHDRDIIRVRLYGPNHISLKEGVAALDNLPKLLQAAACAHLSPRAHYASRLPKEVSSYMETLELGHTERGSYVFKALSPLGTALNEQLSIPTVQQEAPFGRQVVTKLSQSLIATAQAAAHSTQQGNTEALEDAIVEGVSANLLDALVSFGQACSQQEGFSVEFDWATALAAPTVHQRIEFEHSWLPAMLKTANLFKAAPQGPKEVSLIGTVHRLEELSPSTQNAPRSGKIKMWAALGDRLHSVEVELEGHQYKLAAKAHEQEHPIRIKGLLDQQNKKWSLTHTSELEFFQELDDLELQEEP